MVGLIAGAIAGVAANTLVPTGSVLATWVSGFSDTVAHFVGQVFLRLLFLVVVPLVLGSLAFGVASLGDVRKLGRIGTRTIAFFLLTTTFSAALGLTAMNVLRPGAGFDETVKERLMSEQAGDARQVLQRMEERRDPTLVGRTNQALDAFLPRNVLAAIVQMQMLPLILFSLLLGMAVAGLPERLRTPMLGLLEGLAAAMVAIVGMAMKLAPYAVFCLIFRVTAAFGFDLLARLAFYAAIVFGCYLLQVFVFYPVVVRLLARRSPAEFLRKAIPVMVTGFSTSSSSATLPTTLRVAEEDLGVRPQIAGFVLPLGATLNMNGTALFEGAVVLFVAQITNVHLDLGQQALVVVLCVLAAIGTAGVPGGSLPLLAGVMQQVGVPPEGIAIILGVDRLLDMGRTVPNVVGDLAAAVYVESVEGRSLPRPPVAAPPTSPP